jgi:hypothetical protein
LPPALDVPKGVEKADPVLVALENRLSLIAAGCDMVNCTRVLYAEWTDHNGRKIAGKKANVNSKDVTLRWERSV